jgi:ADP-ribose pyrophosphatase YjhB (NUDIX family)
MTKFPGGGLEKGEGIAECILRECKEEFGQDFKIVKHYYTTDFYIESAFHPGVQLISIYYLIDSSEEIKFQTHQIPHHYKAIEGAQSFRWIELSSLKKEDFTYPIDQLIAEKLYADFGNKN